MRTAFPMADGTVKTFGPKLVEELTALQSVIQQRMSLSQGLGQSYGGKRDLYTALGYKKILDWNDYWQMFTRGDIAKRVVSAYPEATWRENPDVYETEDPEEVTDFEDVWKKLVSDQKVFHYLARVDKLAGIGQFAVLLLGFNDGKDASEPVEPKEGMELLYLQPYTQQNAQILEWDADIHSPRYGLPLMYNLRVCQYQTLGTPASLPTGQLKAHWSRVIHVAEGLLESDVYGTPRLEAVFNRMENIGLVAGGSAEMFWRGAFPGINFAMDPTTTMTDTEVKGMEDEVENYIHGLTRYMKLKGIKAESLAVQVADPKGHIDMLLTLVSGATGIPVRILTGSERGELASSQDQENWNARVDERRKLFASPFILEPFVERLQEAGVLPEVEQVNYNWPNPTAMSEKDAMTIGQLRAQALQSYVTSGADVIVPPKMFLTLFLGFTDEEANAMEEEVQGQMDEEAAMAAKQKKPPQTPPLPPPPVPGEAPAEGSPAPEEIPGNETVE